MGPRGPSREALSDDEMQASTLTPLKAGITHHVLASLRSRHKPLECSTIPATRWDLRLAQATKLPHLPVLG